MRQVARAGKMAAPWVTPQILSSELSVRPGIEDLNFRAKLATQTLPVDQADSPIPMPA
jgi:hypothetical protein